MSNLLPFPASAVDLIGNTNGSGQPDYMTGPAARIGRCRGNLTGSVFSILPPFGVDSVILPADPSRVLFWFAGPSNETFLIGGANGIAINTSSTTNTGGYIMTVDTHYVAVQDEIWIQNFTGFTALKFYVVKAMI